MTIDRIPFGRTGHSSSRLIFGAAALGSMRQEKADAVLEVLLEHGINHLDTAAAYGDSELRLAPWLRRHREGFFLASKTGERTYEGARASIQRSLQRLEVETIDLIQLHHLVALDDWETALGEGGALQALLEARERGWVRFLGVTGHGTRVAERHLQSLERFAFDSVLLPYNPSMMGLPEYAADFEKLVATCKQRGVAVQTIKSISRRRWREGDSQKKFSWYEPLRDPEAIRRAVEYVLRRDDFFLNSSSDVTLLPQVLAAAAQMGIQPSAGLDRELKLDAERFGIEPLFVRGFSEEVRGPV